MNSFQRKKMTYCGIYRINDNMCKFSLNGRYLAMALQNNVIVRDAKSGDVFHSFSAMDIVEYIEWSSDSQLLLCPMYKRAVVQVFSLLSPSWKCIIREGDAGIAKACWSPDSRYVLTVAQFNVWICVWSLVTLSVVYIHNLKTSADPVMEFSQDGNLLAVVEPQQEFDCISIISTSSWQLTKQCFCDRVYSAAGLAWSPDSTNICVWDSRADHCAVQIMSAGANLPSKHFKEFSLGVQTVGWSPSGQFLALGCYDGKVHLLNHITWQPVFSLCHADVISSSACNVYRETKVKISPTLTDEKETETSRTCIEKLSERPVTISRTKPDPNALHLNRGVGLVSFSPCSRFLVSRDDSMPAFLWIWDVKSGNIHSVIIHCKPVVDVQWDPCSTRLASASVTTNICLWTPASGAHTMRLPRSSVYDLHGVKVLWHPLGKTLAIMAGIRMTIIEFSGATDFS